MAEALLKYYLALEYGELPLEVKSAGISAVEGMEATTETRRVLQQEKGIDVSDHRSREITCELVSAANLIVVMTERHKNNLLRKYPEAGGKIRLLKEFKKAPETGSPIRDVEDPFGQDLQKYRQTLEEISGYIENMVLDLENILPENFK